MQSGLEQFPGRHRDYEDKLGQSGDKIFLSHITNCISFDLILW